MSTQRQQVAANGRRARVRLRRPPRPGGKLKPERVQLELRSMPGWRLVAGGNGLARVRKFTQAGAAAQWAGHIADLAAAEGHVVTLGVTPYQVTLLLQRPRRDGIDMPLLDFARQLG